jgi:hypothetical protein
MAQTVVGGAGFPCGVLKYKYKKIQSVTWESPDSENSILTTPYKNKHKNFQSEILRFVSSAGISPRRHDIKKSLSGGIFYIDLRFIFRYTEEQSWRNPCLGENPFEQGIMGDFLRNQYGSI